MGVVEWWRPFGASVTQDFYCMCYVYNSGEPGWYESREREIASVCVGTREGRSGDCGRRARSWRCSLSRQGGNDNDNPIRKINNKVLKKSRSFILGGGVRATQRQAPTIGLII